jgi:hypothetical protein
MRFVAWSWLRSVRPTLAQWEDTSDFLAARSPDDNNAVEQDGSLTGNCVFLWHTTPQPSIQKSQLFYLSSIRLWHTRCHHHDCARVCPRLIPNWIIAIGCGLVRSQQQWDDLVYGRTTVSHLCHGRDCREPSHIIAHSQSIFSLYEDSAHSLIAEDFPDTIDVLGTCCNQGMSIIFLGDVMGRVGSSA